MESKEYWNRRYSSGNTSGDGSYGVVLAKKLEMLKDLKDIRTITEVGCGDFNFGRHVLELFPDAQYLGTDISEVIVEKNAREYPQHIFVNTEGVPPADLIMCVDVLLHVLHDDEVEQLLKRLEQSWRKYLVLTAYERDEEMHNHVRIRKFDYKRFGEPIARKVVEDDGDLYMYIFQK